MILTQIQVPVLNRHYDFELDEEKHTGELIEEVTELIREKEGLTLETERYCLYVWDQERILTENETLKEQGVRDGDILYMI